MPQFHPLAGESAMKNRLKTLTFFALLVLICPLSVFLSQAADGPSQPPTEKPMSLTTTVSTPSSLAETKSIPWYKEPTLTGLVGVIVGFLGTGFFNLLLRSLTNKHELRKLFLEKQASAYGNFFSKIVEFDLIDRDELSVELPEKLMQIMVEFERSYPFLDRQTIGEFNEKISLPFKEGKFTKFLDGKNYEALYDELRHRLTGEFLPKAEQHLEKRFQLV